MMKITCFIKNDVREFYPSTTEKAVDEAFKLAKVYTRIPVEKMKII